MRFWQRRLRRATFRCPLGYRWIKKDCSVKDWWYAARQLRKTIPTAEEYLQANQNAYPWAPFVARHGRSFNAPSEKDCVEHIKDSTFMSEGRCYRNALLLCQEIIRKRPGAEENLRYVEGLAVDPTGAYPHGWCAVGDQVIDPTWPGGYLATYFGLPFDFPWIYDTCRAIKKFGILEQWEISAERTREHFEMRA